MKRTLPIIIVLLIAAVGGGYYWWQNRPTAESTTPTVTTNGDTSPIPPAAEPAIKYPIEAIASDEEAPPPAPEKAEESIATALVDLLGQESVAAFLRTGNLVQRVTATVDNLDRSFASPRLWPVQPISGRFTIEGTGEETYIAAQNSARYTPFVEFVDSIDTARAAALYARLYPLFQNMYAALGFPGKYFNDRVIAVIDHLLATPEIEGRIAVKLIEVAGEDKPLRPWVNYRYVDPNLEALSSGQKIMLRVGKDHRKRLKSKLAEIRRYLTGGGARL